MSTGERQKAWRQNNPEAYARARAAANAKKRRDRRRLLLLEAETQRLQEENRLLKAKVLLLETSQRRLPIGSFGPLPSPRK